MQVPPLPPQDLLRSGRLADLSGLSPDQIDRLLRADPDAVAKAERELRGYFAPGARAQMTFPAGSHFEFAVEGLSEPLMAMPPGQLFAIPRQGTGRGTLVVDAAVTGLGRPTRPLVFKFDGGLLLEASDPSLQEVLDRLGEGPKRFSAFAIGLNPNARPSGSPAEESAVPGQLTVFLGSNLWLRGGDVDAPARLRLCISDVCSIALDTREVPTRAVPRAHPPAPSPLPSPPVDPDLYRHLFDNSNDAQVILDDDTDAFLQVNPAFVRLVGYPPDEIVGRMTARQLIAPESLEAYLKRRTDRFELKLLARDRTARVVDASFRLAKLGDRRAVLGSMRDVTEQKRLQEGNWAKIEEILASNARIGILKEKLERVQEFAAGLYNIRDEAAILTAAAGFIQDRSRLGLAEASFYLVQDDSLVPTHPVPTRASLGLSENEAFAKVLVGDEKVLLEGDRLITALKGMDQNLGVVEARLPAKELETLRGSPAVARSYLNIFGTLANILGLSIENVRLYNRVFKESIHDALTQTYNRRYLDAKLEEEIRRAGRYDRPLSIIMIDLDEFKQINDHHPHRHRQGDVILREIAAVLRTTSREVDIVARYGGDEFIVVMPETPKEGAAKKAAALQRLVQETRYTDLETGRQSLPMSVSVGVAEIPHGALPVSAGELVREADHAMYQDKASRKKARSSG
jgi:diguanylate cyclase (GGDEF)-like protein/PAS domain S-box-containing protein